MYFYAIPVTRITVKDHYSYPKAYLVMHSMLDSAPAVGNLDSISLGDAFYILQEQGYFVIWLVTNLNSLPTIYMERMQA